MLQIRGGFVCRRNVGYDEVGEEGRVGECERHCDFSAPSSSDEKELMRKERRTAKEVPT